MVDELQLTQVMVNILNNAEQAMIEAHGGGEIIIGADRLGDNVRISVADDGPGIGPEHLPYIFDPFFTTKGVGKGTGLGLSTCYGIVRQHGGRIWAENTPGHGATFHVEIPVVLPLEGLTEEQPEASAIPAQTKRILVVDDEPDIRNLLDEALTRERYTVDLGKDGQEAWRMLQTRTYDCILLDLRMPGMSGQQLYRLIEKSNEEMAKRVVFLTGDILNLDTRRLHRDYWKLLGEQAGQAVRDLPDYSRGGLSHSRACARARKRLEPELRADLALRDASARSFLRIRFAGRYR